MGEMKQLLNENKDINESQNVSREERNEVSKGELEGRSEDVKSKGERLNTLNNNTIQNFKKYSER